MQSVMPRALDWLWRRASIASRSTRQGIVRLFSLRLVEIESPNSSVDGERGENKHASMLESRLKSVSAGKKPRESEGSSGYNEWLDEGQQPKFVGGCR